LNFIKNVIFFYKSLALNCLFYQSFTGEYLHINLITGAGANILRGVAGAGVLSGSDKLKEIYVRARVGSN
jgi:hypothetical protein